MLDFLLISTRTSKSGAIEIYPKFIVKKSKDLMIRGGDFYGIWIEERGLWSTEEQDAIDLIDNELDRFANEKGSLLNGNYRVLHLWDAENGMIDRWNKYCQMQMRDNFHILDEKVIFSNTPVEKTDYASKRLPYAMEKGDTSAYDHLMSTIYTEEERLKIEWAIGAIISGDSKVLQKFLVFYGAPGTGKSTVLNIIQKLFDGYWEAFDAKTLGSSSSSFALEAFRENPLIAIQHDGDLSRIEDNTRLNSIVSHESQSINVKFRSSYSTRFKTFLFLGTNKPVKITDAKSGLLRRLIDVSPSGEKLKGSDYKKTVKAIDYELGAIAWHCREVYEEHKHDYDDYIPMSMMGASNDFFNFMLESYGTFVRDDGTTLKAAWEMYKVYCDEAKVPYPYPQRIFKEELKNYFREFDDRYSTREDGSRCRNYYEGFKREMFEEKEKKPPVEKPKLWLTLSTGIASQLDKLYSEFLAQYATNDANERPLVAWSKCVTFLSDIDTSKVHYLKPPENLIVIDIDVRDANGEKSLDLCIEEAQNYPPTYAEVSKSGNGLHLHYIYTGDVTKLATLVKKHVEIKTFTGGSALRRRLTWCNDLPIATISSGLPLRKEKMVNLDAVKDQRELIRMIKKNLEKGVHPDTSSSINYISKLLHDAYDSGMTYDVSNLYNAVFSFAAQSSNQADRCMKLVEQMPFKSKEETKPVNDDTKPIMIFDLEVKPNMNLFCGKELGEDKEPIRIFNPKPIDIENLVTNYRLIGYNNLEYDNHILYAMMLGKTPEEIFDISNRIIVDKDRNAKYWDSKHLSYTDIYDFITKKQSLKKYEIELGIPHMEFNQPWDQPIEKKFWDELADYCVNDVRATEAVFMTKAAQSDFAARLALADVAGLTPNDTTNTLTTKIIFGNNRHPQTQFNYRDMGEKSDWDPVVDSFGTKLSTITSKTFCAWDAEGRPIFPGYEYKAGVSTYRGEEVGEGGYVYAEPGIYTNVALLDIASMHPSSIIAENLFGDVYTKRFKDIVDARIAVKHKDFEKARTMLDGALAKYLEDESKAGDLAQALKIAINSVYGLTAAKFDNPFRDIRNKDNIVAKRGALFMVNLKHEVQNHGFTVAHIKTDSIKIPNATPEIIEFVTAYGKLYGYNFEHEATYDRMCLVNDAVYIAKYASKETCEKLYGYIPEKNAKYPEEWTATGTQFQVPYVFKTLFSHEPIIFKDLCETKSVKQGEIFIDMNEDLVDVSAEEKELAKLEQKYKKGLLSDTEFEPKSVELSKLIAKGHNYIFVGRVGSFCPILKGRGGGILYRRKDGKHYAVTGTKGYRWLESEVVKAVGKEDAVDESYYIALVDEAKDAINEAGARNSITFDDFVNGDIADVDWMNKPIEAEKEELPF